MLHLIRLFKKEKCYSEILKLAYNFSGEHSLAHLIIKKSLKVA